MAEDQQSADHQDCQRTAKVAQHDRRGERPRIVCHANLDDMAVATQRQNRFQVQRRDPASTTKLQEIDMDILGDGVQPGTDGVRDS